MTASDSTCHGLPSARVLVVDDEPQVRSLITRWLGDAGYQCLAAPDAAQARALLAAERVDIVTCDINMPGLSGIEWLPQLLAEHPDLAVLMLTGCDDTRLAIGALTQGASGYMLKPLAREELLFQVSRALERRQLLRAQREYTENLERTIHEQTQLLRQAHEETIERLITASMVHDDETGEHIRRIGLLSADLARAMNWTLADVDTIRLAAPMHDIGKVGIPDAILRKPGKLTAEEHDQMKRHTLIGAGILAGSRLPMLQMAEKIARWHHERWDGQGYPDGLAGEAIPLCARIVAVVDVYDALTHDRVYRAALPEDEALAVLDEGTGTHFDPAVALAFLRALPAIRQTLASDAESSSRRRLVAPCGSAEEEGPARHADPALELVSAER